MNQENLQPHRENESIEVQGTFLMLPYDFRFPTSEKIKHRLFNPNEGMLVPKVFGWGCTFNFAHPGTWVFFGVIAFSIFLKAVL